MVTTLAPRKKSPFNRPKRTTIVKISIKRDLHVQQELKGAKEEGGAEYFDFYKA